MTVLNCQPRTWRAMNILSLDCWRCDCLESLIDVCNRSALMGYNVDSEADAGSMKRSGYLAAMCRYVMYFKVILTSVIGKVTQIALKSKQS